MKPSLASRLRLGGPVVLMYHGIGAEDDKPVPSAERKYLVSDQRLSSQLRLVRQQGLFVRPLGELCNPSNPMHHASGVSITFDDGHLSDYTAAYPVLAKSQAPATFFLSTAVVGRRGYLNWSQIAEMQRAGMSFQSHGHEHVYLTRLPSSLLDVQLRMSKRILEDRLGEPVNFLAVPFGDVNRRVMQAAFAAGYKSVCTSWSWPARVGATCVNRVPVYSTTTDREFAKLLHGNLSCYARRAVRAALLHLPKRARLRFLSPPSPARMSEEHA